MKKGFVFILISILLSVIVLGQEPFVDFNSFKCDSFGVLSFKADYNWHGYKQGYMYLKSVKINAISDVENIPLEGEWYKFENKEFPMTKIMLNSPTAYFFSNKNSLEEGMYSIEIDYAISKDNIERFKNHFKENINCPEQKKDIKIIIPGKEEKEEIVEEERPRIPTGEPALFSEETKSYNLYYVIGLLILIFIVSIALMKRLPKKPIMSKKI